MGYVRNFCGFRIDMPAGGIEPAAAASVDVGVVSVAMERWNSTLCWRLCRKSVLTGPSGRLTAEQFILWDGEEVLLVSIERAAESLLSSSSPAL